MTDCSIVTEHYLKWNDILVSRLSYRAGTVWDAEDAVHDAYERALKYLPSFNPDKSKFEMWFNRILVNCLKDHYSRDKGRGQLEFDEELVEGVDCSEYNERMMEQIKKRIAGKQPHIAEILSLYFNNQYKAVDISRMVESTHFACNQVIHRFREELRRDFRSD